jgi:dTDP-4-dehydrorhamnose reductase
MESSILNQPAKRPPKTGFIIEKAQRELGYHPMDFKSGVSFVKKQLEGKKPLFEVTRLKNER